jgi:hypothetical protein
MTQRLRAYLIRLRELPGPPTFNLPISNLSNPLEDHYYLVIVPFLLPRFICP